VRYEPKPGDICVFENEKAGHESAPDHRGYFVAHRDIRAGEKVPFALWCGRTGSARSFGGKLGEATSANQEARAPTDLFGNPLNK
jgi:hypothetical protein